MTNRFEFDAEYLKELIAKKCGTYRLSEKLGISYSKFEDIIFGTKELRYSEMIAIGHILCLTAEEFDRCFFMPKSSENLN